MPELRSDYPGIAEQILQRCDVLGAISALPNAVCRTYLTPEHRQCNELVSDWMRSAGLEAWQDSVGNQWGRLAASANADAPALDVPSLIVGSHLDTIPNAGKYDGILGVLLGLAVAEKLKAEGQSLPFHLDIVGFGDEEGSRFGATLLGSRAVAGTWDPAWFALEDSDSITLLEALEDFGSSADSVGRSSRAADALAGYIEVHIEQGPVLEQADQPLGVVTSIAGARRFRLTVQGQAGHAGTVPMSMRQDALVAAAHIVLLVEQLALEHGIVATVGDLSCQPGAANVIPGQCTLSMDIRADSDSKRDSVVDVLQQQVDALVAGRGLRASWTETHRAAAVACAEPLQQLMADALTDMALPSPRLMSGAGHDAMAVADICDIGMLFVRCAGGVSHHPDESVTAEDVALAIEALERTVLKCAQAIKMADNESPVDATQGSAA